MANLFFRLKGTVITKIWWQVIIYTIFVAIVVVYHEHVQKLQFQPTLISLLGVVLGLLLGFRSSTAYERYSEGRKLWTALTGNIRLFTRNIWLGVKENDAKDLVEKKSALNLAVAFSFATKHYLRREYRFDYEDMKSLLGSAPQFTNPSTSMKHPAIKDHLVVAYDCTPPTNVPLQIAYHLTAYVKQVITNGTLDASLIIVVNTALSGIVDTLANFERILRTPIPLSYAAHLYHILGIYLLSLPFQLVNSLEWYLVPCLAFTAFCLLGILQIGWEIENPFGYDDNDLPLDDYCWTIRQEVEQITSTKFQPAEQWLLSSENMPLAPYSMETAADLSNISLEDLLQKLQEAGTVSQEKYKTRKEWQKEMKKKK